MCLKNLRWLFHIAIKTQLGPALQTPSMPQVYNLPQTTGVFSQISGPKEQFFYFTLDVLCGSGPSSPTPASLFTCSVNVLLGEE